MEIIGRFPRPEEATSLKIPDAVPVWLPADNVSELKDNMKESIQLLRKLSLK